MLYLLKYNIYISIQCNVMALLLIYLYLKNIYSINFNELLLYFIY